MILYTHTHKQIDKQGENVKRVCQLEGNDTQQFTYWLLLLA